MDSQTGTNKLKAMLEGLIFTSGEEGLSVIQLQSVLESLSRQEIGDALEELRTDYASAQRGIELVCYGGKWKLMAKPLVYPVAERLYAKARSKVLSPAAMEVLALVAYHQPITRVEIDEIRGVSSEMTLKKLQARSLVETCGHLDVIGRPLLYQVTESFLDAFGMESLSDLPECEMPETGQALFEEINETNFAPGNQPDHTPGISGKDES